MQKSTSARIRLNKPWHKMVNRACLVFIGILLSNMASAQINEDKLGGWYMYFFNTTFKESQWGIQGDIQYRNWNIMGDLEQLLLRGGITYKPVAADIKFTL